MVGLDIIYSQIAVYYIYEHIYELRIEQQDYLSQALF